MRVHIDTDDILQILLNDEKANWTHRGAKAMDWWLEEMWQDTGNEMHLCQIAEHCRGYKEFDSLKAWLIERYGGTLTEAFKVAGIDLGGEESEDDLDELIIKHIEAFGQLLTRLKAPFFILVSNSKLKRT